MKKKTVKKVTESVKMEKMEKHIGKKTKKKY